MTEENLILLDTQLSYIDLTANSAFRDCNELIVSPASSALSTTSTSCLNSLEQEYLPKENPHAYGLTKMVNQCYKRQNHLRGPLRNLQMHQYHGPHNPMHAVHGFLQHEMGDQEQCGTAVQSCGISGDAASKATKQVWSGMFLPFYIRF